MMTKWILLIGLHLVGCKGNERVYTIDVLAEDHTGTAIPDATISIDGIERGRTKADGRWTGDLQLSPDVVHLTRVTKHSVDFYYGTSLRHFTIDPDSDRQPIRLTAKLHPIAKGRPVTPTDPPTNASDPILIEPEFILPPMKVSLDENAAKPTDPTSDLITIYSFHASRPLEGSELRIYGPMNEEVHCRTNGQGKCHLRKDWQGHTIKIIARHSGMVSQIFTAKVDERPISVAFVAGRSYDIRTVADRFGRSFGTSKVKVHIDGLLVGETDENGYFFLQMEDASQRFAEVRLSGDHILPNQRILPQSDDLQMKISRFQPLQSPVPTLFVEEIRYERVNPHLVASEAEFSRQFQESLMKLWEPLEVVSSISEADYRLVTQMTHDYRLQMLMIDRSGRSILRAEGLAKDASSMNKILKSASLDLPVSGSVLGVDGKNLSLNLGKVFATQLKVGQHLEVYSLTQPSEAIGKIEIKELWDRLTIAEVIEAKRPFIEGDLVKRPYLNEQNLVLLPNRFMFEIFPEDAVIFRKDLKQAVERGVWYTAGQDAIEIEASKVGYQTKNLVIDPVSIAKPSQGIIKITLKADVFSNPGDVVQSEQNLLSVNKQDPDFVMAQVHLAQLYAQRMESPVRAYELLSRLLVPQLDVDLSAREDWTVRYNLAVIECRWPGQLNRGSVDFDLNSSSATLALLQQSPVVEQLSKNEIHFLDYTSAFVESKIGEHTSTRKKYVEKYSSEPNFHSHVQPLQQSFLR